MTVYHLVLLEAGERIGIDQEILIRSEEDLTDKKEELGSLEQLHVKKAKWTSIKSEPIIRVSTVVLIGVLTLAVATI